MAGSAALSSHHTHFLFSIQIISFFCIRSLTPTLVMVMPVFQRVRFAEPGIGFTDAQQISEQQHA